MLTYTPEGSEAMAGNATAARQRAENEYRNAKKGGASGRDLATLRAAYAAAQARENSECGTNYPVRD